MESSAFTFNNNLAGTQMIRSSMQESTGPKPGADFSFRFNPSNSISTLNPGHSTMQQEPFRYTIEERK
jgi:hypothetical protein